MTFSNPRCVDWTVEIAATEPARTKPTRCTWRPARIKPVCPDATAIVVQGKPAQSGAPVEVTDLDRAGTRRVKVEFDLPTGVVTREVTVTAGGATVEAACASPSP